MVVRRTTVAVGRPLLPVLALLLTVAALAQELPGPVARYGFEDAANLGFSTAQPPRPAEVVGGRTERGRDLLGMALTVNGTGGLRIPAEGLDFDSGFALDFWVKFATVTESVNIASRDGQFLLRLDPVSEGCNLSFFVQLGEALEPRVRAPRPEPNVWYHLIATWDGEWASLWVNGRQYRQSRRGGLGTATGPVVVGAGSKWAEGGLKGSLDEVRLYTRPLSDGEIIAALYELSGPAAGPPVDTTRFEFARDEEGWTTSGGNLPRAVDGRWECALGAGEVAVHRNLRFPVGDKPFVALRFAVTGTDKEARLAFLTARGAGERRFPLRPDGQPHSYILRLDDLPEWDGELQAMALGVGDGPAQLSWDFVRIGATPDAPPELTLESFLPATALPRAGRPNQVTVTLRNAGGSGQGLQARLTGTGGVQVLTSATQTLATTYGQTHELTWQVQSAREQTARLLLDVTGPGITPLHGSLEMPFGPAVPVRKLPYIPEPEPAPTKLLIGAHHCPLWEADKPRMWDQIVGPHPERMPALGLYNQEQPEVADWETKWAVEHGISFFVYCWYRSSQGGPVTTRFSSAIEQALFHSRFEDKLKWTIMWENQSRGTAGVADERDLMENLLPYWLNNYFKRPSYLKVDNKPVLFIYRPELLVQDLGGVAQVRVAFDKMRQACRDAGFAGLYLMGEYRGLDRKHLEMLKQLGLDYTFAYCWHVQNNPTPAQAIAKQMADLRQTQELGVLPQIPTFSQAWSGWADEGSVWKIPPREYEGLLRQAKDFVGTLPQDQLGSKMLLLDNWNEWGEGHYIAPHREYGFGLLDAVRKVFSSAPEKHVDLLPEDIGRGPYDTAMRAVLAQEKQAREVVTQRVTRPGSEEPELAAWWSFDEDATGPYALDYSGHGQGGILMKATRAPGKVGQALVCDGGNVAVPAGIFRSPTRALTVEAWVRTDTAGQNDKWFVNCVYGQGAGGFRFGLAAGRLCWAVPLSPWSHHLTAREPLPLGRWVHVAGICDGEMLRVYMDGREVGSLARRGRILPVASQLSLGNYDTGHRAYFAGLLDDVRIFSRALTPAEIAAHAAP